MRLTRDYDVFLLVCHFLEDAWYANAIQGWRDRCRTSICVICEVWPQTVETQRNWLPVLSEFDHVVVGFSGAGAGKALGDALGRPCHEIDPAVDAIRFSPLPMPPPRVIDVYSVGRRWEGIHRRLLSATNEPMFYMYNTVDKTAETAAIDHIEHRMLYANLIKRSRFFVVAPAKMDRPEETRGQPALGYRYFEGAAAGAVLIGQAPDSEAFRRHFDWPDAVVDVRRDGSDAIEVMSKLTADPARLRAISWRNVEEALRRHDWVYRWREVLALADVKPRPQMEAREVRLAALADLAREHAKSGA